MVRVPKKPAAKKKVPQARAKRNRLERLAFRKGVRLKAHQELMKLATILSPE